MSGSLRVGVSIGPALFACCVGRVPGSPLRQGAHGDAGIEATTGKDP